MAFLSIGLDVIAPSNHGNNSLLAYTTGDALAVVQGANYFDGSVLDNMGAKVGDTILAFMSDGTKLYRLITVDADPSNVVISAGLVIT